MTFVSFMLLYFNENLRLIACVAFKYRCFAGLLSYTTSS